MCAPLKSLLICYYSLYAAKYNMGGKIGHSIYHLSFSLKSAAKVQKKFDIRKKKM